MIDTTIPKIISKEELLSWLKYSPVQFIEAPSCMPNTYICGSIDWHRLLSVGFHHTGIEGVVQLFDIRVVLVSSLTTARKVREALAITGLNLWLEGQQFYSQCFAFQKLSDVTQTLRYEDLADNCISGYVDWREKDE